MTEKTDLEKAAEEIAEKFATTGDTPFHEHVASIIRSLIDEIEEMKKEVPDGKKEIGWLIERTINGYSEWVMALDNIGPIVYPLWTTDSFVAIRFTRQQDALALAKHYTTFRNIKCTEHIWLAARPEDK